MTTHVPINGSSRSGSPTARLDSAIHQHLGDPKGAERVREEAQAQFQRNNPRVAEIRHEREIIQITINHLKREVERRFEIKAETDLTRQCWGEVNETSRSTFDRFQFCSYLAGGGFGLVMACNSLAHYVADSGVIAKLDGDYWGSLLFAATPISGAFAFKALGDLLPTDRKKQRYYLGLGAVGVCALMACLTAMSGTFGPKPNDLEAVTNSLLQAAPSVQPVPSGRSFADLAAIFVLGTGLVAETCISPVVLWAATKLNQSKRTLLVTNHEAQVVHDKAIEAIVDRIKHLNHQDAELGADEADLRLRQQAEIEKAGEEFEALNREFNSNVARLRKKLSERKK